MQYAIELFFDNETERKLTEIAEKVAAEGLNTGFLEWKTRPHVTLACFRDVDEAKCVKRLSAFAKRRRAFPVCLGSVGMFADTKAVFASPVMTEKLYRFHKACHRTMRGFDTKGWEWYLPGIWVPHAAVALNVQDDPEAFYKASELVLHGFSALGGKLNGSFTEIGLIKITRPVEEILTVSLK